MDYIRAVNTVLTPITLFVSVVLLTNALDGYKRLKTEANKPVALVLAGIGVLFSAFSIFSVVIYWMGLVGIGGGHMLSGWRSLIQNVMIQLIASLMIRIYREEV